MGYNIDSLTEDCVSCRKFNHEKCEVYLYLYEFLQKEYAIDLRTVYFECLDVIGDTGKQPEICVNNKEEKIIIEVKSLELPLIHKFNNISCKKFEDRANEIWEIDLKNKFNDKFKNLKVDIIVNDGVLLLSKKDFNMDPIINKIITEIPKLKYEVIYPDEECYGANFSIDLREYNLTNEKVKKLLKYHNSALQNQKVNIHKTESLLGLKKNNSELQQRLEAFLQFKNSNILRNPRLNIEVNVSMNTENESNISFYATYNKTAMRAELLENGKNHYTRLLENACCKFQNYAKNNRDLRSRNIVFFSSDDWWIEGLSNDYPQKITSIMNEILENQKFNVIDEVWLRFIEVEDSVLNPDYGNYSIKGEKYIKVV